MKRQRKKTTSWEGVNKWYRSLVGEKGQHYHRNVILPQLMPLLELDDNSSLLDLACGNGILAKELSESIDYLGVDISPSLIKEAKKLNKKRSFVVGDITQPLETEKSFTHAVVMLALQNIEFPEKVFQNCHQYLKKNGTVTLILNHPCFRIPRQSDWGFDEGKKLQYRRMDRYLSPLKIPIAAHPSQGKKSETTLSFHRPLSDYVRLLKNSGFAVTAMEEWCSDKISTGGRAKMENRARKEFPLFMAIQAVKI